MRRLMTLLGLASAALLSPIAASCPVVAAEKTGDELAEEAANQFVKAVKAKDVKEALKLAAVPWLDVGEEKPIKDEGELKTALKEKLDRLDPERVVAESIEVVSYAKVREQIKDEAQRKVFDEVLDKDKDDRIVLIAGAEGLGGRFLLVQVRDGKARVVGGPYGVAYLSNNRVPKAAKAALQEGDRVELFSLDPPRLEEKPPDHFHGWRVLGKTLIKDAAVRKTLVGAFLQGVEDSDGAVAGCFNPRHGIRVAHKGRITDFVICFECLSVKVHTGDEKEGGFLIADSPQGAFNKILADAKVPLPKKADD